MTECHFEVGIGTWKIHQLHKAIPSPTSRHPPPSAPARLSASFTLTHDLPVVRGSQPGHALPGRAGQARRVPLDPDRKTQSANKKRLQVYFEGNQKNPVLRGAVPANRQVFPCLTFKNSWDRSPTTVAFRWNEGKSTTRCTTTERKGPHKRSTLHRSVPLPCRSAAPVPEPQI